MTVAKDTAPAEASISTDLDRIPNAAISDAAPDTRAVPVVAVNAPTSDIKRLETLVEQILQEVRRSREVTHSDFSVSKLLAGIVQVIAAAIAFLAYLDRETAGAPLLLLCAIFLQCMTASLLIMSRQK